MKLLTTLGLMSTSATFASMPGWTTGGCFAFCVAMATLAHVVGFFTDDDEDDE